MNDKLKIAAISAIALIAGVYLFVYFSPYQTCVRSLKDANFGDHVANLKCAERLGGSK